MSATLKWGLITGMIYIFYTLLPTVLGLKLGPGAGMGMNLLAGALIFAVTFFTTYLGIKEIRDEEKSGFITLGEAFMAGLKITLIATLVTGIFSIFNYLFIDPNFGDKIMEGAEAQWDEANVPEEQREMGRKITGYMINPYALTAMTVFSVIFWGVIKSLISGMMLKKLPPITMPPSV